MEQGFALIADLGLPVAGGLIMAYFIFLVMKQMMDALIQSKPYLKCSLLEQQQ